MPPSALPPFRFGVQCSSPPEVTARSWRELARKVEDLGYHRLTVSDHLDDQLAPVAALMAAADATTTLRVGVLVLSNDYRHPAVLAKEAATLDILSEGRFELGLGAGWMTTDYERAGIPMDRPGVRIARLEEAVQVVRGLLSAGPCHFEGEHYRIDGLTGSPKPVQRPLPLLIGGGGRKVLELAGRHADIVGLNPALPNGVIDASAGPDATAEATERKIGWIRAAAGDRFAAIELHTRIHLALVTEDRAAVADAVAAGFGMSVPESLETPHALVGSVDQIVDDLLARRERYGISSIGLSLDALDAFAPVVARLSGA
ncbi:TIGR03621 family F420-dependent LLM class oxidoreductase [Aquihabitans sp. G128]|uniref:TIGR03621 family F420-dependent LLM class oxidoreductase n=1 Tax=Aquihabitans sp. G128 TaxID=2849779 RepID=UPI001C23049D|nr:TIGR03621 family F420-dependent LLM class oxidoreductase [Aquihabitans sp. G128]QXC61130.1 TIGR03621 family F420-dependent LLM class oxidoreductase [Aquihabitans sp. G128]